MAPMTTDPPNRRRREPRRAPPLAARIQHSRRDDRHDAAVRGARLDLRRAELHRQSAAAQDHDPAGVGDRHHRRRRHAGHHHGRHRPVVGLARRHDRDVRREPRPDRGLHPRDLSEPDRAQSRSSRWSPAWSAAWRPASSTAPDRLHQDPAVHRHARHDGVRARRRRLVHERPADRQSRGFLCRDRLGLVAGHHLPRRWR